MTTVFLLHPPLPLSGVSIGMWRACTKLGTACTKLGTHHPLAGPVRLKPAVALWQLRARDAWRSRRARGGGENARGVTTQRSTAQYTQHDTTSQSAHHTTSKHNAARSTAHSAKRVAVGETVFLLHPPLPLSGVSIGMWRGCQQDEESADGPASGARAQGWTTTSAAQASACGCCHRCRLPAPVRTPGTPIKISARALCMSRCANLEFRVM